jgi:serine/threonine protein kinase
MTAEPSIISRLVSATVNRVNSLRGVKPDGSCKQRSLCITPNPSRRSFQHQREQYHREPAPVPSAEASSPYGRPSVQPGALNIRLNLKPGYIGRGTFATVYDSEYCGKPVAVKRVKSDPNFCTREVPILELIRDSPSAGIVAYLGHYEAEEDGAEVLYLVMEKLPMNLRAYANMHAEQGCRVLIDAAVLCLHEVLLGLAHLHTMRVCHRDLKPDNILVNPATNAVKICDFGSSKFLEGPIAGITYICSRTYRAPELILENSSYSFSVDIWSLGCIFGELLSGAPLFQSKTNSGQLALMMKVLGTPSQDELQSLNPSIPPSLDKLPASDCSKAAWSMTLKRPLPSEQWTTLLEDRVWAMLDGLLAWSPEARPAAKDAVQSELFCALSPASPAALDRSLDCAARSR